MLKPLLTATLLTMFTLVSATLVMAEGDDTTLAIENAWTTPSLTKGGTIAVYFTAKNESDAAVTINAANSTIAESGMMHETRTNKAGVSSMEHLMQVESPAHRSVKFEQGGLHVMLVGVKQPLKAGESFPLILELNRAEPIDVNVQVRALDSKALHHHSK